MYNKKGISAVVATVLIILITVAAVTIIWAAIIPMIQERVGGSTECLDASAALTVIGDYSCTNTTLSGTNATVEIQVHRGTGNFMLQSVQILLGAGGNTMIVENTTTPAINQDILYTISYDPADVGGETVSEASVAGIVASGANINICDASGKVTLRTCA